MKIYNPWKPHIAILYTGEYVVRELIGGEWAYYNKKAALGSRGLLYVISKTAVPLFCALESKEDAQALLLRVKSYVKPKFSKRI